MSNTSARKLLHRRIIVSENSFAEMMIWTLPLPVRCSEHLYKYRLAYVVNDNCVLRYDNEAGKGDHRHWFATETAYAFSTPEQLLADFMADIGRWNHGYRNL